MTIASLFSVISAAAASEQFHAKALLIMRLRFTFCVLIIGVALGLVPLRGRSLAATFRDCGSSVSRSETLVIDSAGAADGPLDEPKGKRGK